MLKRSTSAVAHVSAGLIAISLFLTIAQCKDLERCSRTCVVKDCDAFSINYGKYCGIGHSGCPGEPPCDGLDACCKAHDECVGLKGLTNVGCHERMKRCLTRVKKSGEVGFSAECPVPTAAATMINGMNLAILFGQFGDSISE